MGNKFCAVRLACVYAVRYTKWYYIECDIVVTWRNAFTGLFLAIKQRAKKSGGEHFVEWKCISLAWCGRRASWRVCTPHHIRMHSHSDAAAMVLGAWQYYNNNNRPVGAYGFPFYYFPWIKLMKAFYAISFRFIFFLFVFVSLLRVCSLARRVAFSSSFFLLIIHHRHFNSFVRRQNKDEKYERQKTTRKMRIKSKTRNK